MAFNHLSLLLLIVPPVLWMMLHSHRRQGFNLLIGAFSAALLLSAVCLTEFIAQQSKRAASTLAVAVTSLSETELRKYTTSSSGLRRSVEG
jgi:hypothetical protein